MNTFPHGVPGTHTLRPGQILQAGQDQMLPLKKYSILYKAVSGKIFPS